MSTFAPRAYQVAHIDALVEAIRTHGVAKDGSDAGAGKTFCALFAAKKLGMDVFVACPKALVSSWRNCARDLGVNATVINYEKLRTGNTDYVRKANKGFRWDLLTNTLLVMDEDHYLGGQGTLTAKLAVYARHQRIPMLLLSATSADTPLKMWALGFCLGLHRLTDYWDWLSKHGCKRNIFNGWEFDNGPLGKVHLKRLHAQIYGPYRVGSRICTADVPDFPKGVDSADSYTVDKPAQITAIYTKLASALKELETKKEADVGLPLTMNLRARQEVELCKVPVLLELARNALAQGNSALVFVNFRETLTRVVDELATHNPAIVVGGQTDTERDDEVARFQSNQTRLAVCMIQAGGVGLSFHDIHGGHPRESIISPGWSATQLVQTMGRTVRDGAKTTSVRRLVFAANTIEDQICAAVKSKLGNLSMLNDGDLDIPFNLTA
jgi:superfamily II DNA or RNA helicase